LKECFVVLRAAPLAFAVILFATSAVLAGEPLAPSEIQTTFFTGQAFTATTPSGTKFKMNFTPDGKMIREPLAQRGNKSTGVWKLNARGFCTTWGHSKSNCFTIVPSGENKWSVQGIATTIATTVAIWSK
jgi:hypothetical protein